MKILFEFYYVERDLKFTVYCHCLKYIIDLDHSLTFKMSRLFISYKRPRKMMRFEE